MNSADWNMLLNVTFKTQSYRKNFDFVSENENFITEHDGVISEVRIAERKPPLIIGEYGFSVWNIGLGMKFGADFNKLINEYQIENAYSELISLQKNKSFDIKKYKKVIIVHSLILRSDYRKRGITEEFTEFLYREFYDENNVIIALVKPFQNNPIDADYYSKRKSVPVRENLRALQDVVDVPAIEYYSLNNLMNKNDTELNEYKLFGVATNCGFKRIDDSHLFLFSPEKTIGRILEKQNKMKINKIN